jgi:DNA-binding GntR family transcriptional regulator
MDASREAEHWRSYDVTDAHWTGSSTPYLTAQAGDTWAQEAATFGAAGSQRIIRAGEAAAPVGVASHLRVPPTELVIFRERLVLLDDQPVELGTSYWPAEVARGTSLAEARKIRGGAVSVLAGLGYSPASVEEYVSTRPPTDAEKGLLNAGSNEWVLALTRVIRDSKRPYEVSVMVMPGRSARLNYSMKVGS